MNDDGIDTAILSDVWEKLRELATPFKGESGAKILEYSEFVRFCLYDEKFGYYAQQGKTRVGGFGADFYTSESLPQKIFSELIKCAAQNIAQENSALLGDDFWQKKKFAELGAEPNSRMFDEGIALSFSDKINLESSLVVVSNELLDARPFSRFVFLNSVWNKIFLRIPDGKITFDNLLSPVGVEEIALPATQAESEILNARFPNARIEKFIVELSFDAEQLFEKICKENWNGVLIFADYFRSADEICRIPQGTARAYFRHTLLKSETSLASLSDITFSPCSDTFEGIAKTHGLKNVGSFTQESFFVKFASDKIREIIESKGNALDPRRRELVQLLNPALMGEPFRVLCAVKQK